jgi:transposase
VSNQKDHQFTGNLGRVYKTVLQNSANGIRADEIAEKLNIDRTTVYSHLSSLRLRKLVLSDQGYWKAITEEQPLEKEIVIELPIPKDQGLPIATLEIMARKAERAGLLLTAEDMRILLEKLKETRTITIKGKNVDDLDLEKVQNLVLQANQKSSKINLKRLIKKLGISRADGRSKIRNEDINERQNSSET